MLILLTNDDGIYADGIAALYKAFQDAGHAVTVVAPSSERSAVGHAITVSDPLRVNFVEVEGRIAGYAVAGTPADCVKLALNGMLDQPPEMVFSGINHGANTGNHVIYSGTVSAATEATMFGIPSVAISLDGTREALTKERFAYAARFAAELCATIVNQGGLPQGTLLNVNVPALDPAQIKDVRVGKQARFDQADEYERRLDPFKRTYYWPKLEQVSVTDAPDVAVDYRLLKAGHITISPIQYDLTDYAMLRQLATWIFPPVKTA